MPFQIGERVGDYQVVNVLGAGGMASVYEATHRNGIRVAVKILHPEMSQDPEMCQRFLREGYVANKVGRMGSTVHLGRSRARRNRKTKSRRPASAAA